MSGLNSWMASSSCWKKYVYTGAASAGAVSQRAVLRTEHVIMESPTMWLSIQYGLG